MSDIESENVDMEEIIDEEPPEPVFEIKEKPKKGRAPMSDERKEQLREQLRIAREKKKANREKGVEQPKPPKVVKVLEATDKEPAVYVKNVKKIVNSDETNALKKELEQMKKEKENAIKLKQEKKELAAQKRKATKERKELEKKLASNVVAKPAEPRPPPPPPIVEPDTIQDPIYSTYKKSIWAQLMI